MASKRPWHSFKDDEITFLRGFGRAPEKDGRKREGITKETESGALASEIRGFEEDKRDLYAMRREIDY
ncbi:MAG: hypothetical protein U9O90_08120 [Euryarchaeota archaeon]|nr:hypothetical protein [Euryarchaeota archaeon]